MPLVSATGAHMLCKVPYEIVLGVFGTFLYKVWSSEGSILAIKWNFPAISLCLAWLNICLLYYCGISSTKTVY